MSASAAAIEKASSRPNLDGKPNPLTGLLFIALLVLGLGFSAWSLFGDITGSAGHATTWLPYFLLGIALLIALAFEFVNGFHDTANAVATVIYTHSLPANVAVCGPASSTSSVCWCRAARSRSASSRCCRWN